MRWQFSSQYLRTAIIMSLVLHGFFVSVRFVVPPEEHRRIQSDGLEVVLVNARSDSAPAGVDVLAQQNLVGGGMQSEDIHAKTWLSPQTTEAEDLSSQRHEARPDSTTVEDFFLFLLPQSGDIFFGNAKTKSPDDVSKNGNDDLNQDISALDIRGQLTELIEERNKGSRRLSIGISAKKAVHAMYTNGVAVRIEQLGKAYFPSVANGRPFSVMVSISIRSDGSLEKIDFIKSSGEYLLDIAASRIIERAFPFSPFPYNLRKEYDAIDMVRTIYFIPSGTLLDERSS